MRGAIDSTHARATDTQLLHSLLAIPHVCSSGFTQIGKGSLHCKMPNASLGAYSHNCWESPRSDLTNLHVFCASILTELVLAHFVCGCSNTANISVFLFEPLLLLFPYTTASEKNVIPSLQNVLLQSRLVLAGVVSFRTPSLHLLQ